MLLNRVKLYVGIDQSCISECVPVMSLYIDPVLLQRCAKYLRVALQRALLHSLLYTLLHYRLALQIITLLNYRVCCYIYVDIQTSFWSHIGLQTFLLNVVYCGKPFCCIDLCYRVLYRSDLCYRMEKVLLYSLLFTVLHYRASHS